MWLWCAGWRRQHKCELLMEYARGSSDREILSKLWVARAVRDKRHLILACASCPC